MSSFLTLRHHRWIKHSKISDERYKKGRESFARKKDKEICNKNILSPRGFYFVLFYFVFLYLKLGRKECSGVFKVAEEMQSLPST